MKYDNQYTLGLDVGITSCGFALVDVDKPKLIEMGVRHFDEAEPAANARKNRSVRRTLRRKKWRKQQLKNAFVNFGILTKEEIEQDGYMMFSTDTANIRKPEDHTIYHLRQRATREEVSSRELLLALYNICKTRGHFLLETINFTKDGVTFDMFKDRFYALCSGYVSFADDRKEFENKILRNIFCEKYGSRAMKADLKKILICTDDESLVKLETILNILCGAKGDLAKIGDETYLDGQGSNTNMLGIKKFDALSDFEAELVELYDLAHIYQIIREYNYICDLAVDELDKVIETKKLKFINKEEYKEEAKKIQDKMIKAKEDSLKVIKNVENNYPNGLYVKEVRAILNEQKKYNSKITDAFIEVVCSIVSARIPYFIGPLNERAKNNWAVKTADIEYSYDYSLKHNNAVNEFESIKAWKERMISRCTYLVNEPALPKGSFVGDVFSIINELNNLSAWDENDDSYYLTQNDKVKIIDELFLKERKEVKYKDVEELLGLKCFGTARREDSGVFKNQFELYWQIVSILSEYKVNSVLEVFNNAEKIDKLEEIILNINLFDEEKSKQEYFHEEKYGYGYSFEKSKALARLKSKSFFSFSKKLLLNTSVNEDGECVLAEMLSDNGPGYSNSFMATLSRATDIDGNPLSLDADKYVSALKNNGGLLTTDLIIEDGKPVIPISRMVIRGINECFKVYEAIIKYYGVPKRVVIETARDMKDSARNGQVPAKHFAEMKRLYEYLVIQKMESRSSLDRNTLDSWNDLSELLKNPVNRQKVELYIRQNGVDPLTLNEINIANLSDYEVDHILPRGFGDDSMDDKMLILRSENSIKGDRVPLVFMQSPDYQKLKHTISEAQYIAYVNGLHKAKLISDKKKEIMLLATTDEARGFINRNLVDTRYIVKELMAALNAYNKYHDYQTHIVALKAAFTDLFKKAYGINKNRNVGLQHHAHDAFTVAIADAVLSSYYPNYDSYQIAEHYKKKNGSKTIAKKNVFAELEQNMFVMQKLSEEGSFAEKKELEKGTSGLLRVLYKRKFGESCYSGDLMESMRSMVPLYSEKVLRNWKGNYFDATLYKPILDEDEKSVLSVLGVNNKERSFRSVNCIAVDIYKVITVDKKGNRKGKHYAIHIPAVIVNNNGVINQEQYIKLIKEHYAAEELLDCDGNLRTECFRFRVFKNDVVYDTSYKELQTFNIGSIVNKKLDLKAISMFDYNTIYKKAQVYRNLIIKRFNLKTAENPSGKDWKNLSEIDTKEINNYACTELIAGLNKNSYGHFADFSIKNNNNKSIYSYSEYVAYFDEMNKRKCKPQTIIGQYMPTVTRPDSTKTPSTEWIKIKYSPLGIRFRYENDGLIIEGPSAAKNAFSKIKKEEFSWKISQFVLE